MAARKTILIKNEFYHIFNRGVDKRNIFLDKKDVDRFFQSILEFNSVDPIGSIYENSFKKNKNSNTKKLITIIAYCINLNHFHLLVTPNVENGIEKFMQKLGMGYTKFFNEKYDRVGSLFQGPFKSVHVKTDSQLRYLSAYISLNYKIHQLGRGVSKLGLRSSWKEYIGEVLKEDEICDKSIILEHFKNRKEYKEFAEEVVREVIKQRKEDKELDKLLIE